MALEILKANMEHLGNVDSTVSRAFMVAQLDLLRSSMDALKQTAITYHFNSG